MRGYSETHVFSSNPIALLETVQGIVRTFPDEFDGQPLRCHEVAHAIGCALDLEVVDGKYGTVEHSWLLTSSNSAAGVCIIDPYAVGRLPQVQLVAPIPGIGLSPYSPRERRTDIKLSVLQRLTVLAFKAMRPGAGARVAQMMDPQTGQTYSTTVDGPYPQPGERVDVDRLVAANRIYRDALQRIHAVGQALARTPGTHPVTRDICDVAAHALETAG